MKIGFAIGNGPTRKDFDLELLRGHGTIVGCNWLYRDFSPDIIVSLDRDPQIKISAIPRSERSWKWLRIAPHRRSIVIDSDKSDVPEHVMGVMEINGGWGRNSGVTACSYLAQIEKVEHLYMIGFDFFRILPGMKSNDLYVNALCKFSNFEKAFDFLASNNKQTQFIRVGPIHENDVQHFEQMNHFTFIDYPEFEERLATNTL